MSTTAITTATRNDIDRCIAVIALAFSSDPAMRWMYPDSHRYVKYLPRFVQAFAGGAFERGTAHIAGHGAATALWLPPGAGPDDEALVALIEESVPPDARGPLLDMFERMSAFHPHEPHWHLPLIGTDPRRQGNGDGSALLRHTLGLCDAQRLPAYLEATSEASVPLYRRHGFEVLGTIQSDGTPPIFPMLRRPRALPLH